MTLLLVAVITVVVALLAMLPKLFNWLMVVILSVAAIVMLLPVPVYMVALWVEPYGPMVEWFRAHGIHTIGPLGIVVAFVAVMFLQGFMAQTNQDGP